MPSFRKSDHGSFDPDLIARHHRDGPRYTSYPTADRFAEAFNAESYGRQLARRRFETPARPWSLYVHLPFCATVCYYCGCNKIATRDASRASGYVDYLLREVAMHADQLGDDRRLAQVHWGGGTPTFLPFEQMRRLMLALRSQFDLLEEAEVAIEVDPRTVDAAGVEELGSLGFNRMSIGVQDFDPDVQAAVNRIQSEAQTLAVMMAARKAGFRSLNVDLIYGLPRQSSSSFERTLDRVIAAEPDRIALYSYAHLPQTFKPQRRIDEAQLPSPQAKLQIFATAIRRLTEAGFVYIGMDHFAKPDDELAVAQREGRLQRNFQGYSTRADCDLIALGVSGIGAVGASYYQNQRQLTDYCNAIDRGVLPIMRGFELTPDDLLRRAVIHNLMCHFALSMEAVETAHRIDFEPYFRQEVKEMERLACDGLVELRDRSIVVTPLGRFLVRNICMVFDRYLREREQRARYSKVI
jgi:oxygen-independent coproporphyrinogen III oxidase